ESSLGNVISSPLISEILDGLNFNPYNFFTTGNGKGDDFDGLGGGEAFIGSVVVANEIEHLVGGGGTNNFVFHNGAKIQGTISAKGNVVLDYSDYAAFKETQFVDLKEAVPGGEFKLTVTKRDGTSLNTGLISIPDDGTGEVNRSQLATDIETELRVILAGDLDDVESNSKSFGSYTVTFAAGFDFARLEISDEALLDSSNAAVSPEVGTLANGGDGVSVDASAKDLIVVPAVNIPLLGTLPNVNWKFGSAQGVLGYRFGGLGGALGEIDSVGEFFGDFAVTNMAGVVGSPGADMLTGNRGNNVFDLSAGGNDIVSGGFGSDLVTYRNAAENNSLTVDLWVPSVGTKQNGYYAVNTIQIVDLARATGGTFKLTAREPTALFDVTVAGKFNEIVTGDITFSPADPAATAQAIQDGLNNASVHDFVTTVTVTPGAEPNTFEVTFAGADTDNLFVTEMSLDAAKLTFDDPAFADQRAYFKSSTTSGAAGVNNSVLLNLSGAPGPGESWTLSLEDSLTGDTVTYGTEGTVVAGTTAIAVRLKGESTQGEDWTATLFNAMGMEIVSVTHPVVSVAGQPESLSELAEALASALTTALTNASVSGYIIGPSGDSLVATNADGVPFALSVVATGAGVDEVANVGFDAIELTQTPLLDDVWTLSINGTSGTPIATAEHIVTAASSDAPVQPQDIAAIAAALKVALEGVLQNQNVADYVVSTVGDPIDAIVVTNVAGTQFNLDLTVDTPGGEAAAAATARTLSLSGNRTIGETWSLRVLDDSDVEIGVGQYVIAEDSSATGQPVGVAVVAAELLGSIDASLAAQNDVLVSRTDETFTALSRSGNQLTFELQIADVVVDTATQTFATGTTITWVPEIGDEFTVTLLGSDGNEVTQFTHPVADAGGGVATSEAVVISALEAGLRSNVIGLGLTGFEFFSTADTLFASSPASSALTMLTRTSGGNLLAGTSSNAHQLKGTPVEGDDWRVRVVDAADTLIASGEFTVLSDSNGQLDSLETIAEKLVLALHDDLADSNLDYHFQADGGHLVVVNRVGDVSRLEVSFTATETESSPSGNVEVDGFVLVVPAATGDTWTVNLQDGSNTTLATGTRTVVDVAGAPELLADVAIQLAQSLAADAIVNGLSGFVIGSDGDRVIVTGVDGAAFSLELSVVDASGSALATTAELTAAAIAAGINGSPGEGYVAHAKGHEVVIARADGRPFAGTIAADNGVPLFATVDNTTASTRFVQLGGTAVDMEMWSVDLTDDTGQTLQTASYAIPNTTTTLNDLALALAADINANAAAEFRALVSGATLLIAHVGGDVFDVVATPPSGQTAEVRDYVISVNADGGVFSLILDTESTSPLAFDVPPAALTSALVNTPNLTDGDVKVVAGPTVGTWYVDFANGLPSNFTVNTSVDVSNLDGTTIIASQGLVRENPGGDTVGLSSIESMQGTQSDDLLIGNAKSNTFVYTTEVYTPWGHDV
ncbi:MAG: hypothetical protein ACI9HK_005112, partial [Pirellulaceae bacterium]